MEKAEGAEGRGQRGRKSRDVFEKACTSKAVKNCKACTSIENAAFVNAVIYLPCLQIGEPHVFRECVTTLH